MCESFHVEVLIVMRDGRKRKLKYNLIFEEAIIGIIKKKVARSALYVGGVTYAICEFLCRRWITCLGVTRSVLICVDKHLNININTICSIFFSGEFSQKNVCFDFSYIF